MNEILVFSMVLIAGILLGTLFFGGLWWTVRKGLTSNRPGWWFFGSTLLRTGFALAGFYYISNGDWRRLMVGLLGFVIGRVAVTWFTRKNKKGIHAS
jgi:F1F0 ATPase subunit 2